MSDVALVGRGVECGLIDEVLHAARGGRSGALVLRGEAGIGKSRLLDYAEVAAPEMTTLRCTGRELDTRVSYAGVVELVHPIIHLVQSLPDPQAAALSSMLSTATEPVGRFSVALALLDLLAEVARAGPVLMLVDDAHWIDDASVEALRFTANRIRAEGIVVLIAERDIGRTQFPGLRQVLLRGLEAEDVGRLLEELGFDGADPARLLAVTAGNPLAVAELGSGPVPSTSLPAATSEALREAFLTRVARVPDATARGLLVVAASGPSDMPYLEAVLERAGLDLEDLVPAEAAGLVSIGDGGVEFLHPLVRSAVYHAAQPAQRRGVHAAFARAMSGTTVAAVAERRIVHLGSAASTASESVAGELEEVGRVTAGRRSYGVAAQTLERAAQLSVDPETRSRRYLIAATYALSAGRLGSVSGLLQGCLEWSTSDELRATAAHLGLRAMLWQGVPDAMYQRLSVLDVAQRVPVEDGAVLLAEAGIAHTMRGNLNDAHEVVGLAMALAEGQAPATRMPVLLMRALLHALDLEYDAARVLLGEAESHLDTRPGEQWVLVAPFVRLLLDDLKVATTGIARVVEGLRSLGALELLPTPLFMLARSHLLAGRLLDARTTLAEAMSLVGSIGASIEVGDYFHSEEQSLLAEVAALTGQVAECRRHASAALRLEAAANPVIVRCRVRRALGLLALGSGEAASALEEFRRLDDDARVHGLNDLPILSWLPDLAETELIVYGRHGETHQRLVERAERLGTVTAQAHLQRIEALASHDADGLLDAARLLDVAGRGFESARSRLDAARVLRRRKDISGAREQLGTALQRFETIGAAVWLAAAQHELRACGVTVEMAPLATSRLTPQEYQVAQRAATGKSNAEIASALFLSVKTVEFHLSNAFRKLGVTRRIQLAVAAPGLLGSDATR